MRPICAATFGVRIVRAQCKKIVWSNEEASGAERSSFDVLLAPRGHSRRSRRATGLRVRCQRRARASRVENMQLRRLPSARLQATDNDRLSVASNGMRQSMGGHRGLEIELSRGTAGVALAPVHRKWKANYSRKFNQSEKIHFSYLCARASERPPRAADNATCSTDGHCRPAAIGALVGSKSAII